MCIRDRTYQARNGEVEALGGVSFDVAEGEFVSIVGPSGCGKSTLLGVLAGLETLDGGAVSLYGQPVTGASGRMGFMPQRDQLFEWRSIRDNVMPVSYTHLDVYRRQVLHRAGQQGDAR